jgi:hypothetical protein
MQPAQIPNVDVIAFLSLIVALSAYVATIRLRIIDKKSLTNDPRTKKSLSRYACWLILADAALIAAGVMVFFHGFWQLTLEPCFPGQKAPEWLIIWSVRCFAFACLILIIMHISTWRRSIKGIRG